MDSMKLPAWSVRFVKRFVQGIAIRLRERHPSLDAGAPSLAHFTLRLAAWVGLSICLAILLRVAPSVTEALRSPDPWTREGLVVLLVVAWLGLDALSYGRLAVR